MFDNKLIREMASLSVHIKCLNSQLNSWSRFKFNNGGESTFRLLSISVKKLMQNGKQNAGMLLRIKPHNNLCGLWQWWLRCVGGSLIHAVDFRRNASQHFAFAWIDDWRWDFVDCRWVQLLCKILQSTLLSLELCWTRWCDVDDGG